MFRPEEPITSSAAVGPDGEPTGLRSWQHMRETMLTTRQSSEISARSFVPFITRMLTLVQCGLSTVLDGFAEDPDCRSSSPDPLYQRMASTGPTRAWLSPHPGGLKARS